MTESKKKVEKVEFNGEMVTTHQLILLVNSKWNERLKLSALEKFIKHELTLKTSPMSKLAELNGVKSENITYDFIKAVYQGSRLIDSKGKAKKRFSPFSWLKDLEAKSASGEIATILKMDEKTVKANIQQKETARIELAKVA